MNIFVTRISSENTTHRDRLFDKYVAHRQKLTFKQNQQMCKKVSVAQRSTVHTIQVQDHTNNRTFQPQKKEQNWATSPVVSSLAGGQKTINRISRSFSHFDQRSFSSSIFESTQCRARQYTSHVSRCIYLYIIRSLTSELLHKRR